MKRHGESGTRLYHTWGQMKQRCQNPKDARYPRYGGRGIKVCDEWQSYVPFWRWSEENGYDDSLTIDRIDNDGNYEPSNCRWITGAENRKDHRNTKYYVFFGERKSIIDWSRDERCKVSLATIYNRLAAGQSMEDAIFREGRKRIYDK